MALINVPDIQNLDAATPELWNSRYGTIVNEINGNLDSNNLKDSAVTTAKLGASAVTSSKIVDGGVTSLKIYNAYKFSAYQGAALSALGNGVWTNAPINTKDFDTSNNFDTTNSRFVAPIAGFYSILAQIGITDAGIAGGPMIGALYKNGGGAIYGTSIVASGNNLSLNRVTFARLFQLAAGDYIELFGYVGEAGRNIIGGSQYTFLSGFLVSAT